MRNQRFTNPEIAYFAKKSHCEIIILAKMHLMVYLYITVIYSIVNI